MKYDENYNYYQEYYLIKDNIVYKIIINKDNKEIYIKCKSYCISLNISDLLVLTKIKFDSINKAYEFILNNFEENKVIFENIIIKKEIILLLKNNEVEIELVLEYNKQNNIINNNSIYKDIKEIKKEINNLKEENKILKIEID